MRYINLCFTFTLLYETTHP